MTFAWQFEITEVRWRGRGRQRRYYLYTYVMTFRASRTFRHLHRRGSKSAATTRNGKVLAACGASDSPLIVQDDWQARVVRRITSLAGRRSRRCSSARQLEFGRLKVVKTSLEGRDPELAQRLIENITDRAIDLVALVEDLSLRTVTGRLARLLLESATGDVLHRPRWYTQFVFQDTAATPHGRPGRSGRTRCA